jgi:uncharacterized PurR-regulated membrane protein YhhQ (DUF165 family)
MIILYLTAIVIANLSVAHFGPDVAIYNAFLFIGLDLTTRDYLHERWQGKHLWRNMVLLIGTGSVLSAALNWGAAQIALASFVAFACAGFSDVITYQVLWDRQRLIKINGSNVISAGVDSIVFPVLAFGFPIMWKIAFGMFVAKIVGGFVWSLVIDRYHEITAKRIAIKA